MMVQHGYMALIETSEKWIINPKVIKYYCSMGKVSEALKKANTWLMLQNLEKSKYNRRKHGEE